MNNNESIFCIATPQIIAVAHIPTQLASHWEYNIYQLVKNKNINTDIKIFIHPSIQPINHILIQHENQEWGKSTKISAIEHINKEEITKYRYYIYSKNHQGVDESMSYCSRKVS